MRPHDDTHGIQGRLFDPGPPAEADVANRAALERELDIEQLRDFQQHEGFRVRSPQGVYWVSLMDSPLLADLESRTISWLYVHAIEPNPTCPADEALAILLWLKGDPGVKVEATDPIPLRRFNEVDIEEAVQRMAVISAVDRSGQ